MTLVETKSPLKSLAVGAGTLGALNGLNQLLPLFGIPALPISEVMTAVVGFTTGIAAIWGRWRAKKKISL